MKPSLLRENNVPPPDPKVAGDARLGRWHLRGRTLFLPGYLFGCKHPSLVFDVVGEGLAVARSSALIDWLELNDTNVSPETAFSIETRRQDEFAQALDLMIRTLHVLQLRAGLAVFERGRVLTASADAARCSIPTTRRAHGAMATVVERVIDLFASWSPPDADAAGVESLSDLGATLADLRLPGSNMLEFARLAHTSGIPVREMPGGIHLFGLGSRGRWLEGSFTDATPNLAARLARNKQDAASVLRMSGLPAPAHALARTAQDATVLARKIGYPVVVKPADLDGGVGVTADLTSAEEVIAAFTAARRRSRNVLVEKHCYGRDYRLTVFQDQLLWAVERIPAGVTGDDCSSVSELVERENANPLRSSKAGTPLKPLTIDTAALNLLRSQGLDMNSIVSDGQFVRLCSAANIASGGTPVAVFEQVHPDNALLAVRAARALKLDIAGVDLIIPDIAVSWRNSGAAICEVNGQPNIGQLTALHLYAPILQRLMQGNGRIPVVAVVTPDSGTQLPKAISETLEAHGMRSGYHDTHGVHLDGQTLAPGLRTPFDAGQILALEGTADAMVLKVSDASVLQTGLPVSRIDLLIDMTEDNSSALTDVKNAILPACDGRILRSADLTLSGGSAGGPAAALDMSVAAMIVAKAALEIDQKHRDSHVATPLASTRPAPPCRSAS